jgi:hypothetical protein
MLPSCVQGDLLSCLKRIESSKSNAEVCWLANLWRGISRRVQQVVNSSGHEVQCMALAPDGYMPAEMYFLCNAD